VSWPGPTWQIFRKKILFSNFFKTSKMILKTFWGHNIVFLTQKNPSLAVFCPKNDLEKILGPKFFQKNFKFFPFF
jgi:hypothetical protein